MTETALRQILSYTLTTPVILPLIGALLGTLLTDLRARRVICLVTLVLTTAYVALTTVVVARSGPIALQVGNWPAPFGITFVADMLSLLMLLMSCCVGLAVLLYSFGDGDSELERYAFHPLLLIQLLGVHGAFLAGDIFNLYVWFEVLLMASFALIVAGSSRDQLQAGIPYLVLNLLSSVMFLIACGLLYGVTGTLNLAQLTQRMAELPSPGISTVLAVLFLLGYAIKAGTFPLFSWLPVSYHTPPVAVTALFSALMTKVGVYALLRIFPLIFPDDLAVLQPLILWAAALTMVIGVLGALAQYNVRRLLSFHIISQVGYLLMAFAIGTPAAIGAAAFFIVHVSISKAALFMVGGVAERTFGTADLRKMGGLAQTRPGLAVLFAIAALSLAGIPPLGGFLAKLYLLQATFEAGAYIVGGVGLAVSLLTTMSMLKIWNEAFWKPVPDGTVYQEQPRRMLPLHGGPILALAVASVLLGLTGGPVVRAAEQAGRDATDRAAYVRLVLGEERVGGAR